MSKEEYLKKYLSGEDAESKKKKRRRKVKTDKIVPRLRIVDDDVDFKTLLPENLHNTLEEDVGDDDPTVADVVDERPEELIRLEQYRRDNRWKTLGKNSEENADSRRRHDSSSDSSPTFKDSISRNRKRHDSDSDQSPVRRKGGGSDSDQSPPRRQRHDSDSDQSPPRRQRHDSDSDQSPPRKQRHDSDSDQSPPRRKRGGADSDQSPPRRKRGQSDSDQSPPRRKRGGADSDQSPPRRKRGGSDSDQSPPRRKRGGSDPDQSPPRKKRHDSDSDQSPPRRKRGGTNSSQSPSKKRHSSHRDSPAIKIKSDPKDNNDKSSTRKRKSRFEPVSPSRIKSEPEDREKPILDKDHRGRAVKTLSGATAGLSSAKQMREEARLMRQREDEMFEKLDDGVLGKNAKTVVRERKRKTKEEKEQEERDEAKKAELQAKYQSWNKGLKQAQYQQAAVDEAIREMDKPLARHEGDADLEDHLKAQDREGDPMLAFIKKNKTKKDPNKKELPRYKGPQPPMNRFNIWPGYRWDGLDRSSGFEKQIVAKSAERKAVKEIAYKWSVEDM